jgi:hypothetical protein
MRNPYEVDDDRVTIIPPCPGNEGDPADGLHSHTVRRALSVEIEIRSTIVVETEEGPTDRRSRHEFTRTGILKFAMNEETRVAHGPIVATSHFGMGAH